MARRIRGDEPDVKITRMRIAVAAVSGLVVVGAAAALAIVLLTDSRQLRYPTQAALRDSLATSATAELRRRGITLGSKLSCADIPGWTKLRLRAGCRGSTSDRRPVHVIGTGEDRTKTHHFTILVDGRPVVENAGCLGDDCHRKTE
jgi:hypothetical protein